MKKVCRLYFCSAMISSMLTFPCSNQYPPNTANRTTKGHYGAALARVDAQSFAKPHLLTRRIIIIIPRHSVSPQRHADVTSPVFCSLASVQAHARTRITACACRKEGSGWPSHGQKLECENGARMQLVRMMSVR